MTPSGLSSIEIAKNNGSWSILDEVEELTIPKYLENAFNKNKGLKDNFLKLSKSVRKLMLYSILSAKKTETKQKRVNEIIKLVNQKFVSP